MLLLCPLQRLLKRAGEGEPEPSDRFGLTVPDLPAPAECLDFDHPGRLDVSRRALWRMSTGRRPVHDTHPDPGIPARPQIPDPRTLLSVLDPSAWFQASGYQVIGGIRLKVLRAAEPGRLTHLKALNSLPGMHPYGEHVASLQVWVDQQQVVHRMAFTFSGPIHILDPTKPVSKAAVEAYQQAKQALTRLVQQRARYHAQTGKWLPASRLAPAREREEQAYEHAFRILPETAVEEFTLTFSAIGQPQHIIAPRHALPDCVLIPRSFRHHRHCSL